jgi:maleylacetoacetate isomerase
MRLYSYFRSSTAYRVRIGLNIKRIAYDTLPVHLVRGGGEQHGPWYRLINPQGRVPSLLLDDGDVLIQSGAILRYLDDMQPEPPFFPEGPLSRAKVNAVADIIGCDIHPLNNAGSLNRLRQTLISEVVVAKWYAHWINAGFDAIEQLIDGREFCFGRVPTLADIYLVPQVFNARRFNVALDAFPKIVAVEARCSELSAFRLASPEMQPDAE